MFIKLFLSFCIIVHYSSETDFFQKPVGTPLIKPGSPFTVLPILLT